MAVDDLSYNGADQETLLNVVRQAVARLCSKNVEDVKPDEDGEILCSGDSAGILVSAMTDPSALIFRSYLLDGIKESPALYALINEINVDIGIGQVYYNEKFGDIRYYYKYLAESPSVDLVAYIICEMIDTADLYDDRLKTRLGGECFIERADDEVDV